MYVAMYIIVSLYYIACFAYSGLPVPIVAIAAGIANKNYGSERGLVCSYI